MTPKLFNNSIIICIAIIYSLFSTSCSSDDNTVEPVICPPGYTHGTLTEVSVIDYNPAPGQFINEIPEYEIGDNKDDMNRKATESLNNGDMISLGSFGGSVTLKLMTPIKNIDNKPDFRILGNAVYAVTATSEPLYGSAEPGIVLVMQDTNGNGLADDIWYELQGDQTQNSTANFTITYYIPTEDATDSEYIRWVAQNGETGYINRNSNFHTQNFFPSWINDIKEMTFVGRRLPDNGKFNTSTNNFDLTCYNGYADSHPNTTDNSNLDIDNAIDANGNHVNLSTIDFVKIYTGVLQTNGPLGECSTEIAGVEILQ